MGHPVRTVLALLKPTNLLAAVLLVAVAYGGITVFQIRRRADRVRRERQELSQTVERLQTTNARLRHAVQSLEEQCVQLRAFAARLTADTRVADVRILEQTADEAGVAITTLEFTELDPQGTRLDPRRATVLGREVYFDALVLKFADDAVKVGDPLRGKSLHVFRRTFGSAQEPRNGVPLAADGIVPDVYRGPPTAATFERALWARFWHWADHPAEAEAEGVRVAQIEAVGIRPRPHATYRITLRHAGGLDIRRVEPAP